MCAVGRGGKRGAGDEMPLELRSGGLRCGIRSDGFDIYELLGFENRKDSTFQKA